MSVLSSRFRMRNGKHPAARLYSQTGHRVLVAKSYLAAPPVEAPPPVPDVPPVPAPVLPVVPAVPPAPWPPVPDALPVDPVAAPPAPGAPAAPGVPELGVPLACDPSPDELPVSP